MGPRPTSLLLSASGSVEAEAVHARSGLGAGVVTALLIQTVISGGTYLVAKRALAEVPVSTLVLWRFLLSGAVFALLVGLLPGPALPPRRAVPATFLLGFLAGPLNQGLFFAGLQKSTAAHAALLYALTPIGVYVYSLLRGREAPSARAGLGLVLALAGALVLLLAHGLRALHGVFEAARCACGAFRKQRDDQRTANLDPVRTDRRCPSRSPRSCASRRQGNRHARCTAIADRRRVPRGQAPVDHERDGTRARRRSGAAT